MPATTSESDNNKVPDWLKAELFEPILKDKFKDYVQVKDFKAYSALAPGENYATVILRIEIEVELKDNKQQTMGFILKLPQDVQCMRDIMQECNVFDVEQFVYREIMPEMEQMYRVAGVEVTFAPKAYNLNVDRNYMLLEDLCKRNFENANRLEGLDMEQMKCVLEKLALFHAASATRVARKGHYGGPFNRADLYDKHYGVIKIMYKAMEGILLKAMESYEGHEEYIESVRKLHPFAVNEQFATAFVDDDDFNVLNHSDCWTNNIMFQYDSEGKVSDTLLIDFQLPNYATPAIDIIYFILSSAKYELKVQEFDFFVRYYHDHLIANLKLLEYPKKLPSLKEMHAIMLKHGGYGYTTVITVLGAALLPSTESANLENLITADATGDGFKTLMFTNEIFRKHAEILFPWLHNRGGLACSQNWENAVDKKNK